MTLSALRSAGFFTISPDHPALPGHFPGAPLVPGVVLLDEALALLRAAGMGGLALRHAKFLQPVRPRETIELRYGANGARLEIACLRGEVVVLGARLALP